jgi:hypothetical protein
VQDEGEETSRLRIGGWLAPGTRSGGEDPALTGPTRPPALPAAQQPSAGAPPGTAPATASTVYSSRGRAVHRWWRLAVVAVVITLAAIGVVRIAGGDDPDRTAVPPARRPLWHQPDGTWSLSTPPASTGPTAPPVPTAIPSVPVADPVLPASPAAPPRTRTSGPAKPVTPTVTITAAPVPAVVDLSAEGSLDWVHWGLIDATAFDRRRGATAIEDLGGTPRGRYENNPQLFTWTGGSPTATATRTPTGVYMCGQGATITLRAPAGPAVRTLRVYAGVWMAAGRLTVSVPGATATADLENRNAISTSRFEIRYRATAGTRLTVTWTATAAYHPTCGNIDLQAVTLA